MMRVLMVTPPLPDANRPGSMAPAARQIESLRDCGIEPVIADMRGIPKLKYLQAVPRIRRLARDCDLVHAHFGYCGWLARLQRSKPVVLSFMGSDVYGDTLANGRPGWFSGSVAWINRNLLAHRVDQILVKSQMMADLIAPVPATVVPNGVDLDTLRKIKKKKARRQTGLEPGKRYVLFPGNPENPRKGFPTAEAALNVANELLAAQQQEPAEMVKLWGIPPAEVTLYMNACDAMFMVSLAEGSPNVVKEAMACNRPIVAVPVGDVEWLLSDVAGCHVGPRDPQTLGAALANVLQADELEVGGRARIEELKLDLGSVARRVCQVYERALGHAAATV